MENSLNNDRFNKRKFSVDSGFDQSESLISNSVLTTEAVKVISKQYYNFLTNFTSFFTWIMITIGNYDGTPILKVMVTN